MPNKTKKQKLLADLRKKQYAFSFEKSSQPASLIIEKAATVLPTKTETILVSYIFKDLKKTLILTMLAILFELVLYWWLR